MNVDIKLRPGSSAAQITLAPGETVTAESGAMIAMSGDTQVRTSTHQISKGGFGMALKRMLSGESFFLNHFTAGANGGEVMLASTLPGDMICKELNGEGLVVQGGSYVAASDDVVMDFSWQGFKSAFSGEGLFWIKVSGYGSVVLNSFGAIYPIEIDGEYVVDTGHIVAFDETLDFKISKAGKSIISSFLGGEGLVCKFNGKGTVWCQSHNPSSFGHHVGPLLIPRK